jgi:hypothetical protein
MQAGVSTALQVETAYIQDSSDMHLCVIEKACSNSALSYPTFALSNRLCTPRPMWFSITASSELVLYFLWTISVLSSCMQGKPRPAVIGCVIDLYGRRSDEETGLDIPEKVARGKITEVSASGKSMTVLPEEVMMEPNLLSSLSIEIAGATTTIDNLIVVRTLEASTVPKVCLQEAHLKVLLCLPSPLVKASSEGRLQRMNAVDRTTILHSEGLADVNTAKDTIFEVVKNLICIVYCQLMFLSKVPRNQPVSLAFPNRLLLITILFS